MTPLFPDWGGDLDRYYPWHTYRGPYGDLHAGHLLTTVVAPDVTTGKDRPYDIVRCESCIAIHCWPLPSPGDLCHYYATQFYEREKPEYLARYEQDRTWWETCVHKPLLAHAWELLSQERRREIPRIMEIGAGPGIALDVAQAMGWRTYALEPSVHCSNRLKERGHRVCACTLEQLPQHEGQWAEGMDALYLYEVLEHQPCPEDFLLRCYDLLAVGGVLVVCVPNDFNRLQLTVCQRVGLPSWWIQPPQHLHYFSAKYLQLLLRRCGFTMRTMRGTYPLEQFILDGHNYVGNDVEGRFIHHLRMAQELQACKDGRWAEVEAYYTANMGDYGIGREIVAICTKER